MQSRRWQILYTDQVGVYHVPHTPTHRLGRPNSRFGVLFLSPSFFFVLRCLRGQRLSPASLPQLPKLHLKKKTSQIASLQHGSDRRVARRLAPLHSTSSGASGSVRSPHWILGVYSCFLWGDFISLLDYLFGCFVSFPLCFDPIRPYPAETRASSPAIFGYLCGFFVRVLRKSELGFVPEMFDPVAWTRFWCLPGESMLLLWYS
jgi:hypothetical protein